MSAKDLIKKGEIAIKAKQFENALKLFIAADILDSKNLNIMLKIAALQAEMKNYDKCISMCQDAILIGIEKKTNFKILSSNPYVMMGKAYRKSGDLKNAKKTYENALKQTKNEEKLKVKKELTKIEKLQTNSDNKYILGTPDLESKKQKKRKALEEQSNAPGDQEFLKKRLKLFVCFF